MQDNSGSEVAHKRNKPRYASNSNGTITHGDNKFPCVIVNISRAGAMLQGVSNLDTGSSFELEIEDIGIRQATIIWISEYGIGVSFAPPKLESDGYMNSMDKHLKKLKPLNDAKSLGGFF